VNCIAVSEISMENNDGINGRYTINQFFSIFDDCQYSQ